MNNEASRNIRIEPAAADLIARVWRERWGGELMVTPELVYGPAELEGAAVYSGNELVALVTWRWEPAGAEITSLDAFVPRRGFGSVAMDHAERVIDKLRQALWCQQIHPHHAIVVVGQD